MAELFRYAHRVTYAECTVGNHIYHSRYLDLLEAARGELMRALGATVLELQERDFIFPVIEARLRYKFPARYDDLLNIASTVAMDGRAKIRFDAQISQNANGKPVVRGHTVHAFADAQGKPIRPPAWFLELVQKAADSAAT